MLLCHPIIRKMKASIGIVCECVFCMGNHVISEFKQNRKPFCFGDIYTKRGIKKLCDFREMMRGVFFNEEKGAEGKR